MGRRPKQKYEDLDIDQKAIGKQLAGIRKDRGLTQQELADRLNIARSTIAEYEQGSNHLYDLLLIKLGKILNVTPDKILGIDNTFTKSIQPNLRFQKRIQKIEELPEHKQKALLQLIDAFVVANEKEK